MNYKSLKYFKKAVGMIESLKTDVFAKWSSEKDEV